MIAANSEIQDGMRIDWNVPIEMDDGLVLRADIFRPIDSGRYPVILTYGPYAKGLSFQKGYPSAWGRMVDQHPDVAAGSTNKYQNWEVIDPEKWVPDDYVCIRVDSRGCGYSPGFVDPFSPRETLDFANCIEWAGSQEWSNGKVGLNGVSYYGINQWQVASLQPKFLSAMCVWEGASDWYRDMTHHGGVLSTFWANWYDMQVKTVQYGLGANGPKNDITGDWVCGSETFESETLLENRCRFGNEIYAHPLDDDYHRARSARWDKINVPLLTAANWGGQGLHLRGNFEGFSRAETEQKWLEVHGLEHWTEFYTDYGVKLQKRFFNYFLKNEKNGWEKQPRVQLQVRKIGGFEERHHNSWPIESTEWTRFYLGSEERNLSLSPPKNDSQITFSAMGEGVNFLSSPLESETEITGPSTVKLFVSSSTVDADLFVVLRIFSPAGKELVFQGAIDPYTPIGQGWLRASHRKLDPILSESWRPYHTHDELWPLNPGDPEMLDIEIWPTSIVVPSGYSIGLNIRGKDYEYPDAKEATLSNFKNKLKGCGPFLHDDPRDRPEKIFGGDTTLYFGPDQAPYLLLPVIPDTFN